MSDAPGVGNGVMADKHEFRSSSTEVSKVKYSLNGVGNDVGDDIYRQANLARPGFTKFDQKDMYRMGKIQEFRVSQRVACIVED